MQVVVESVTELARKITITMPSAPVDQEIASRLQQLARTAEIKGFRRGKVTLAVIQQHYGVLVQREAMEKVSRRSLQEALQQEKLLPASDFKIESETYQAGQSFSFVANIEIFPNVTLRPFSELVIEKIVADITEEDLTKTLEGMQKQQTVWETVDRPSQVGDRLSLAFEGTIDGVPFEGGKSDNMPLVLGSKSTIPGFEEGLLNVSTGQAVTLSLVFPENYGAAHLAGKPVQFNTVVNKVEAPQLPPFDDKFAEKFGVSEGGMDKLREEVKATLTQQLSQRLQQKLKAEVMAKLAEAYRDLEVPRALVEQEAKNLLEQAQTQFKQYGGKNMPVFTAEMFFERAKERVRLGLVVDEIIKRDQLKPDVGRVRTLIDQLAQRFEHPEQAVAWYYQEKKRLAEIEALAMEDQIVDLVIAQAMVVEKPSTAADILAIGGGE